VAGRRKARWDLATWRTVGVYALALAATAALLQWVQFQFLVRTHAVELYVVLVALGFMGFGIWLGLRLARPPAPEPGETQPGNPRAQASLGISDREMEVLAQIAAGLSNKEIAGRLHVSPNTVKTHVARLYEKLGANRRTEAVLKARELGMIP
jgi:DNA-binding CsgD family transcriptional regulator